MRVQWSKMRENEAFLEKDHEVRNKWTEKKKRCGLSCWKNGSQDSGKSQDKKRAVQHQSQGIHEAIDNIPLSFAFRVSFFFFFNWLLHCFSSCLFCLLCLSAFWLPIKREKHKVLEKGGMSEKRGKGDKDRLWRKASRLQRFVKHDERTHILLFFHPSFCARTVSCDPNHDQAEKRRVSKEGTEIKKKDFKNCWQTNVTLSFFFVLSSGSEWTKVTFAQLHQRGCVFCGRKKRKTGSSWLVYSTEWLSSQTGEKKSQHKTNI